MIEDNSKLQQLLTNCELELEMSEFQIIIEQNAINSLAKVITANNTNFFKRIFKRKKIAHDQKSLADTKLKLHELEVSQRDLKELTQQLKEKIKTIEANFKNMTQFPYLPKNTEEMEKYYNKDNLMSDSDIQNKKDRIESYRQKITKMQEELLKAQELGLLTSAIPKSEDNSFEPEETYSHKR